MLKRNHSRNFANSSWDDEEEVYEITCTSQDEAQDVCLTFLNKAKHCFIDLTVQDLKSQTALADVQFGDEASIKYTDSNNHPRFIISKDDVRSITDFDINDKELNVSLKSADSKGKKCFILILEWVSLKQIKTTIYVQTDTPINLTGAFEN